jgi:hypothetical protein
MTKPEMMTDLLGLLKGLNDIASMTWKPGTKPIKPARMLARILSEGAPKAVAAKVAKDYGHLLEDTAVPAVAPKKPVMTRGVGRTAKAKEVTERPVDGLVEGPDGTFLFTVTVGPYGTAYAAEQEVQQFRHPNVFMYRSSMFPLPANFRIKAQVVRSSVVPLETNKLNPHAVQLSIQLSGDATRVRQWVESMRNRSRMQLVVR